jgi:hypothetical protein
MPASRPSTNPKRSISLRDHKAGASGAILATARITFRDPRKGIRELDLTDSEAERLGGRPVARRGRRPKSA